MSSSVFLFYSVKNMFLRNFNFFINDHIKLNFIQTNTLIIKEN